jgi:hypothetical protein
MVSPTLMTKSLPCAEGGAMPKSESLRDVEPESLKPSSWGLTCIGIEMEFVTPAITTSPVD